MILDLTSEELKAVQAIDDGYKKLLDECAMFYRCECGEQHTWETDDDFCSYGEKL